MNDKKVLIDTSVWIKYFKDKPGTFSTRVGEVLSRHEVCVPRIVVAELIYGSKTEREMSLFQNFVEAFSVIDQKERGKLGQSGETIIQPEEEGQDNPFDRLLH